MYKLIMMVLSLTMICIGSFGLGKSEGHREMKSAIEEYLLNYENGIKRGLKEDKDLRTKKDIDSLQSIGAKIYFVRVNVIQPSSIKEILKKAKEEAEDNKAK